MAGIEPQQMPTPINGSCRCGNLTLKITKTPMFTAICHCKNCQKMTSGPYSITAAIPPDGFEVTKGEPVLGGVKDPGCQHSHCPDCFSWVFTKLPSMPQVVNVRATMLDNMEKWLGRPWLETQTADKLPWVETGIVKERSFEKWPVGSFEELMKDYQDAVTKHKNPAS